MSACEPRARIRCWEWLAVPLVCGLLLVGQPAAAQFGSLAPGTEGPTGKVKSKAGPKGEKMKVVETPKPAGGGFGGAPMTPGMMMGRMMGMMGQPPAASLGQPASYRATFWVDQGPSGEPGAKTGPAAGAKSSKGGKQGSSASRNADLESSVLLVLGTGGEPANPGMGMGMWYGRPAERKPEEAHFIIEREETPRADPNSVIRDETVTPVRVFSGSVRFSPVGRRFLASGQVMVRERQPGQVPQRRVFSYSRIVVPDQPTIVAEWGPKGSAGRVMLRLDRVKDPQEPAGPPTAQVGASKKAARRAMKHHRAGAAATKPAAPQAEKSGQQGGAEGTKGTTTKP